MPTAKRAVSRKPAAKKKAVARKVTPKKAVTRKTPKLTAYVGLKNIEAVPMTRGEYNTHRGWTIPANENPKNPGYLVVYPEKDQPAGKPYISWSPKKIFENAYATSGSMSFGAAIFLMKQGFKMSRAGWNGKGMWCIYVPGTSKATLAPGTPYAKAFPKRKTVEILPHFDMYTINAKGRRAMLPGWLASQSDIDAEDWGVVK